jgi:hypothetical protein
MKKGFQNLRLGQQVWAVIEDVVGGEAVIVNYGGELLRVVNTSTSLLRAGQRVLLRVQEIQPMKFKLVFPAVGQRARRGSLDFSI